MLRGVHTALRGLGAGPLLDEVEMLAGRARVRLAEAREVGPAGAEVRDPFGLTLRELEVLGCLSDGYTNRQIARALFVTEKTASVHVSNILGKFGVSNRREAAALAQRLGLGVGRPDPRSR